MEFLKTIRPFQEQNDRGLKPIIVLDCSKDNFLTNEQFLSTI